VRSQKLRVVPAAPQNLIRERDRSIGSVYQKQHCSNQYEPPCVNRRGILAIGYFGSGSRSFIPVFEQPPATSSVCITSIV
jgi:hypothetical protein